MSNAATAAFVPHDLPAPLPGAPDGPLRHLRFAAKDMFAIAGRTSGAGNPDWLAGNPPAAATAPVVRALLDAGATLAGITICDEFFFSIAGVNAHYGTPRNPRAPGHLPGGSSSGSASAVAAGAVDLALGSDTGGSVRIPAAFCGISGIRPTHGRVDATGAVPMAPSFDSIGWFTAAPGLLRAVAPLLLSPTAPPPPITRLILATDALAEAESAIAEAVQAVARRLAGWLPLATGTLAPDGFAAWREAFRILQGREIWACHGAWITAHRPRLGPGIAERIAAAAAFTAADAVPAEAIRAQARVHLGALIPPGTALILPTAPCPPPRLDADAATLEQFRTHTMSLTCAAGLAGLPQVSLPLATSDGLPAGLSLLGAAGSDEALLELACRVAPLCGMV